MKQYSGIGIIVVLLSFVLAACGSAGLEVNDPWARPAASGNNSAVYFDINNPLDSDDTLLLAESDVAAAVELHMTMMIEEGDMEMGESGEHDVGEGEMEMGDGVMRMVPQESVAVPGNSTVSFVPGGLHVMLIGLQQDLNVGDTITVVLHFENAGEITIQAPVKAQ